MFIHRRYLYLLSIIAILSATQANAQIRIDNSNFNTSIKKKPGALFIEGGFQSESNLRHQFLDFNIKESQKVYFVSPSNTRSIIAEITGVNPSIINGSIGTEGNSNILFVNPNGIVFGKNAKLDLNGSLLISTANSISLDQDKILLKFNNNSQTIKIFGSGHDRINPGSTRLRNIFLGGKRPTGLDVKDQNSIQLIGGEVSFDGGILTSPSGNIDVIAVKSGQVSASSAAVGYSLTPSIRTRGSITLENRSFLNASGVKNGNIKLIANEIDLNDASMLHVENFGTNLLGEINLNATNIRIDGITQKVPLLPNFATFSRGISSVGNESKGPDVRIKSKRLVLKNQGNIVTYSEGLGKGGDIFLDISYEMLIDGENPFNPTFPIGSFVGTLARGSGNAGNINVKGQNLSLENGAILQSITLNKGDGGNVNINITENLEIDGVVPISNSTSNISSLTLGTLDNSPSGDSGTTNIKARSIKITNGGRISSSSFDDGNSGNIQIQASDIEVSGGASDIDRSQIIASSEILNPFLSRLFDRSLPTGNSGNISIKADTLRLEDSASIAVRADGTGDAGNIFLNVGRIDISNNGSVLASTNGGDGGFIGLSSGILLMNSGLISSASRGTGLGGDINIDANLIATKNDSLISANAENSQAGNIDIVTGTFIPNDANISATSNLGANSNGEIRITQTTNELGLIDTLPDIDNSPIAIRPTCRSRSDEAFISNHGFGGDAVELSERQKKALYLKQRIDFASQFYYIDSETGEKMPYRPLLAIEKNDEGELDLIFSAEQSKGLQNLLSSLDNNCSIKS